jgi:3-oxoacyl-[acyl-carrier-protein] synthase III
MNSISISNIKIKGVSAAVPKQVISNNNPRLEKITGISQRRITPLDMFTSDLCYEAAIKLIQDLNIDPNEIGILVFISQTSDYRLPVTSAILQNKLNLPQTSICLDIPLGCSGYTYGLYVISSLLKNSNSKYGLLLAGDTISKEAYFKDNSTFPLFGDAGTATLVEFDSSFHQPLIFDLGTDGSGYDSIIIPHGGSRHPISNESNLERQDENGNIRRLRDLYLDGGKVFDFGTNKISNILKEFIDSNQTEIDCLILHQANKLMNDRITKKTGISPEKSLSSLFNFGNTSSATIPLTMVTQLNNISSYKNILMCGFGVGLSWASVLVQQEKIHCSNLIEI